jgi:sugar phosphate isomerase/epimerase
MLSASMKRLEKSMANASQLNAELWVLHPGLVTGISPFYPGKEWRQNTESILRLVTSAKELGLRVAIENLPKKYGSVMHNPQDFLRLYSETNMGAGIVLDVGHANLEGQTLPFITQLSSKIWHFHLSDNVGEVDQHLGIGFGKIDWEDFVAKIGRIDFGGLMMLESVFNVEESFSKLHHLFS